MPEAVQKVDEMSNKFNEKSVEYQETIDKSEKMTKVAKATLNE